MKATAAANSQGSKTLTIACGRDKSLTHRAIMFSSLAKGVSHIANPLLGADCLSTIDCFRRLGVAITVEENSITIKSPGMHGFQSPQEPLDCGNSGTTARLLLGLFAGIEDLKVTLIGDDSLSKRPMGRVVDLLRKAGAHYSEPAEYLPITITGQKIASRNYQVDKASAQVKSALILASLQGSGSMRVTLPAGSRDHTEKMLAKMGADCSTVHNEGMETVTFKGPFMPAPQKYNIPVDPSSAAFFVVLGLLRSKGVTRIPAVLDNPTRTGFLSVLERMSSHLNCQKNTERNLFVEATMDLEVEGSFPLLGTDITAEEVPTLVDEIPILAAAAAFAQSPSRFCHLGELRVKESDRLAKTFELLQAAGANCTIEGDDLVIAGGLKRAKPFRFDPADDHRMAMTAAIIAKFAEGPCEILDQNCVAVSFPNFFEELDKFE